jgi:CNT family concentrative nucleoside transporter
MKKHLVLLTTFLIFTLIGFSQNIEKQWKFGKISDNNGKSILSTSPDDYLKLDEGSFYYQLASKDSLRASGNYIYQNNQLVFYYQQPRDTVRFYKITEISDSTLVFKENNIFYSFRAELPVNTTETNTKTPLSNIVPSQGFTTTGILRGIAGILFLLVIAFVFSSNRKAINWRTVGIGLTAQILLAIGVLTVPVVQKTFEFVGRFLLKF